MRLRIGTSIGEAIYVIRYLHDAMRCPGDICEFGVGQGATSALLAAEILSIPERKLWLFDSFEGLPDPGPEDKLIDDIFSLGSMSSYKGKMASPQDKCGRNCGWSGFPEIRTKLKKGWVKETTKSDDVPERVAFAYVDLDFYDPIREALNFLDERMQAHRRTNRDRRLSGFSRRELSLLLTSLLQGKRETLNLKRLWPTRVISVF